MKTKYFGNKVDGYSAHCGMLTVGVKRVEEGWEGSYYGSPALHNPWVPLPDGGRSRSCMCPKITVGVFRTRALAAETTLRALREENLRVNS